MTVAGQLDGREEVEIHTHRHVRLLGSTYREGA